MLSLKPCRWPQTRISATVPNTCWTLASRAGCAYGTGGLASASGLPTASGQGGLKNCSASGGSRERKRSAGLSSPAVRKSFGCGDLGCGGISRRKEVKGYSFASFPYLPALWRIHILKQSVSLVRPQWGIPSRFGISSIAVGLKTRRYEENRRLEGSPIIMGSRPAEAVAFCYHRRPPDRDLSYSTTCRVPPYVGVE